MTIKNEFESLNGCSKPSQNAGYNDITKLVNEEIDALGDEGSCADPKLIDKKLGLSRGTSFVMGGYAGCFSFEVED